jgi:YqaJ-like viral recombinase domain
VKIIDCKQDTPEWFAARLGIPTASEFHKIITAAKGDLSKQASKYAHRLVAETLLGRSIEKPPGTPWAMVRGKEMEPLAVQQYALDNKIEVRRVGFVTTDDGRVGASPDGLIAGTSGGLEIKCVLDDNHVGIWADGPGDDYKQQVQGNLAVAELEWWDLYAWHPDLPPITIRTYRDEPYIAKMGAALAEFLAMRDAMLAKAKADGWEARADIDLETLRTHVGAPATFGAVRALLAA